MAAPGQQCFALQILNDAIQARWKALPREQCEGIKAFVVGLIIKHSSDDATLEQSRTFVNKLNETLVEILKHDWPHNWPSFITDIVGASATNETLCQNNMVILKMLSEDVFEFSFGTLTQAKTKQLKDTMCSEFGKVFQLCMFVLNNSQRPPLLQATLQTLLRFLSWIPLAYIFETSLLEVLACRFFVMGPYRNATLKCLVEIGTMTVPENHNDALAKLLQVVVQNLHTILPMSLDLRLEYRRGTNEAQAFVMDLAQFFAGFLSTHLTMLESRLELHEVLLEANRYLVFLCQAEDVEIFKICLEYWNQLAMSLYSESPYTVSTAISETSSLLYSAPQISTPRRQLYRDILSQVRRVMIGNMAKPEEVLVVENEQGEAVREFMKDTDSINLYKSARECLVYLTHLDYMDTERIMTEKLQAQVDGTEWMPRRLNTLCWAIGSISGAMNEEDEKRFLVIVIKDLLGLCEMKRGKDNKAIIASDIMYIVGQYPRFLRAHWKFLKTVVNKLFEFMHETHEGVQDMACDTFIKIAQRCRRHFVTLQVGETEPFIDEILTNLPAITCDLSPQQVQTFYEAAGCIISSQTEEPIRAHLIERLMMAPNMQFDRILKQCGADQRILSTPSVAQELSNILRLNTRACSSIGHPFVDQLRCLYPGMLQMYRCISSMMSAAIAAQGEIVTKTVVGRAMRGVKKDVLQLIETWVVRCEDRNVLLSAFLPPLLEAVLLDYQQNIPPAREAAVLSCMAAIIRCLDRAALPHVAAVFDALFGPTLSMINTDFQEYPDHRTNLFLLLQAINSSCFPIFYEMPPQSFSLVIDSIVWAFQHTMRNVAETGLSILLELLNSVAMGDAAFAQHFYKTYLLRLMQHIFAVLTDTLHKAGFKLHANILATMLDFIESGAVTVPLFEPSADTPASMTNAQFIREYMLKILLAAFPHLNPYVARAPSRPGIASHPAVRRPLTASGAASAAPSQPTRHADHQRAD